MSKESASVRAPSCANAADKQHHRTLQTSSGTHRTQHPRASPSCPKKPWESEHHLAKCNGQNGNTLAFKCLQALTGLNIPEFWRLVPGSREYPNLLAKMQRTKRHRRDLQRLQALTGLNIPEPRRLAPVSRENPITILQNAADETAPRWPSNVFRHSLDTTSHSFAVLSQEAVSAKDSLKRARLKLLPQRMLISWRVKTQVELKTAVPQTPLHRSLAGRQLLWQDSRRPVRFRPKGCYARARHASGAPQTLL